MRIVLLCVGTRMPAWVNTAFAAYQKRFPREIRLELTEIPLRRRPSRGAENQARLAESQALLDALPPRSRVIALDERGPQYSSLELADRFRAWTETGRDLTLMVGGPNGLTDEARAAADELWSLSRLTLPHPLVRVWLAETLYRACSIVRGLPYHRL